MRCMIVLVLSVWNNIENYWYCFIKGYEQAKTKSWKFVFLINFFFLILLAVKKNLYSGLQHNSYIFS